MGCSSSTPAVKSSLAGVSSTSLLKPTAAVCAKDMCVFGEEWKPAKLIGREPSGKSTHIFTFELPDGSKPLNLSTCACILAKGGADDEGSPVVRPYTPISTNALVGKFELMIKVYPQGRFGQHLLKLPLGDTVDFKHIPFNVKIQYPFNKKAIGMLAGGTGITPMIQALHALLGTVEDKTEISMLYGNQTVEDILARGAIASWAALSEGRFKCTHVLSQEPKGSSWTGERGYVTKDLIAKHLPPPSDDTIIFVCGPEPMYEALCGPRAAKELTGALAEMGYTPEMVFKF